MAVRHVLCALLLAGGCGQDADRPERPDAPVQEAPAKEPAVELATEPTSEPDPSEREFLAGLVAAYSQRVATTRAARTDLLKKQREELGALGDFGAAHARERMESTNLRVAEGQIRYYQKKLAEADPDLDRLANELTKLQGEEEALTERLEELRTAFLQRRLIRELAESPVAADLQRIRAIQQHWFDLTVDLRGRRIYGTRKKKLNASFRDWLGKETERGRVVEEALEKNPARRKPGLDTYDFTDLEFFVLCQELEDDLDRRNVTVELDHLAIQRAKEKKLVRKIDALEEKISNLENSPKASELQEVQAFRDSLGSHEYRRDLARRNLEEVRKELQSKREVQARHEKEFEAAEAAVRNAQAKLAEARAELQTLAR